MTISRRPPRGKKLKVGGDPIRELTPGVSGNVRRNDGAMRRVTEWLWKRDRRGGRSNVD